MKKSLFALAATTAIAGAAQAQSSVTVYGILDVGYVGASTQFRTNDGGTQANGGTGQNGVGALKATTNQFSQSAEQTSRLGFKGTEDLGGGSSAFFTAEFQLYPSDATLSGNTSGGLLNRQTFVGLKKNGIGQAAVGTQYTPVFNSAAATDVGQLNNVAGNVIYASGGNGAGATGLAFTSRTSNTLSAQSDTFAGFKASAIAMLNSKNGSEVSSGTTATGGNTNTTGWGLGLDYTWNKLYATASYQSLKQVTASSNGGMGATATPSGNNGVFSTAQGAGATAAPTGTAYCTAVAAALPSSCPLNVTDNQFFAGATYDFGILKAYANYVNRKATATQNSNYYMSRSAEQIGVRSFITPKVEGWASAGLGRYTSFGNSAPTANFNGWQLGSNYWLSKRTNLYAIYGQTVTSQASYTNLITGGTYSGSFTSSQYALGVRHTF